MRARARIRPKVARAAFCLNRTFCLNPTSRPGSVRNVVDFASAARSSTSVSNTGDTSEPTSRAYVPVQCKNVAIGPMELQNDGTDRPGPIATRFLHATVYVRDMTAAAIRGRRRACQGLHKGTFLPYGSSHRRRSAPKAHESLREACNLLPPRREDECIDC